MGLSSICRKLWFNCSKLFESEGYFCYKNISLILLLRILFLPVCFINSFNYFSLKKKSTLKNVSTCCKKLVCIEKFQDGSLLLHVPYVEEGLRKVGGVEHSEQDGQDHHQDLCEQGPNDPGCYASPARSKREGGNYKKLIYSKKRKTKLKD
jgi:hypothetical protein